MEGSEVTATNVATGSSALYLYDDRLSFKFASTGTSTVVEVDQPANNVRAFRYLTITDHDLDGGTAVVRTYATANRVTPDAVISGSITSADPMIFDAGSFQSGKQFIDVELTSSGLPMTVGEVGLLSKFDSPRAPTINVPTKVVPRRTFIDLPNGERRSISHAQPGRVKSYRITGLTQAQVTEWIDIYEASEGIRLLILSDDEEIIYPVVMNKALPKTRELDNFSVDVEFVEIRL